MKYLIWSARPDFEDWEADLKEQYPDASEDELYRIMCDTNYDYLDDERVNLNITLSEKIVCIADLGLWNGRRSGYKTLTRNIADCLYSQYDPTWFLDENGDLRCDDVHHDGTNHLLYRMWKPGISEWQKENFLSKIYQNDYTDADVKRYTRRIGDWIARVYGWKIRGGVHV